MRVAFYAPLKPVDHPVPSGDRQMARLLVAALEQGGSAVEIVSSLRSFLASPDEARQQALEDAAVRERDRIARTWSAAASQPDLWFTYHNHYKAPDLLGPGLARRFGLPLVMAEASHARSRSARWGEWHRAAENATRAADVHLCFTARDREGIAGLLHPGACAIDLAPFVDVQSWPTPQPRTQSGPVRLLTVAMMRDGDKLESYRFLARSLGLLADAEWQLTIIGDGPERPEVEKAFRTISPDRLRWRGVMSPVEVAAALEQSDLFVWPGFGEAFGLGYLEAQAMGVPVVALDVSGVSSVVQHERTGILVYPPSPDAFADAITRLCRDSAELHRLGAAAAVWVRSERTLSRAATTLGQALSSALAQSHARYA